jgi:hypothetical protein
MDSLVTSVEGIFFLSFQSFAISADADANPTQSDISSQFGPQIKTSEPYSLTKQAIFVFTPHHFKITPPFKLMI